MGCAGSKDELDETEVLQAFKQFDKDGNGFITSDEIQFAMNNLGQRFTDEELNLMIRGMDIDGDGRVNYSEFLRMWRT